MSYPVVARLIQPAKYHLPNLAVWLICVCLMSLQSCVVTDTTEDPPSKVVQAGQWREVVVSKKPSAELAEHCQLTQEPANCQLFEDIAASVRFQTASPDLEKDSLVSLEAAIQPLLDNHLRLSVTTYIDDTGEELLDVLLAKRRTLTVIRFLSNRGVPLAWLQPREPEFHITAESSIGQPSVGRQLEMRLLTE